jgi:O-antigen ligase
MFNGKSISLPIALFCAAFLSLYTLLIFFAESAYLIWPTAGLVSLYTVTFAFLAWEKNVTFERRVTRGAILVVAVLLLLLAMLPLSMNIPGSVLRWLMLALGGTSFIFFFSVPRFHRSSIDLILYGLILTHAILVVWNFGLLFLPSFQATLPRATLLAPIYGHNHAYMLYLFSLVLSLYYWQKSHFHRLWAVFISIFIVGIIICFSRVGLALMVSSLIAFFLIYRRTFATFLNQDLLRWQLRVVGTLLAFVSAYAILMLMFSAMPQISKGTGCIAPMFRSQLCKSFMSEQRLQYASQALQAIQNGPIWGYGGGTFSTLSTRYRSTISSYSAMAHNDYLQFITEFGVVGIGLIVVYVGGLIWACAHWHKMSQFSRMLFIIILLSSLDALTNYNWNITVIFVLHCITLGLFCRSYLADNEKAASAKSSLKIPGAVFVFQYLWVVVPVLWFCGSYIFAELFFKTTPQKYVEIFPYLEWYAGEAIKSPSLHTDTRNRLLKLYSTNPRFYQSVIETTTDPKEKIAYYEHVLLFDPLDDDTRVKIIFLSIQEKDVSRVHQHVHFLTNRSAPLDWKRITTLNPQFVDQLVTFSNEFAEQFPQEMSEITTEAYSVQTWRMNELRSVFLEHPEKFTQEQVVSIISNEKTPALYTYYDSLFPWFLSEIHQAIDQEKWDELDTLVEEASRLGTWESWKVAEQLATSFKEKVKWPAYQTDPVEKKAEYFVVWKNALAVVKKHSKKPELLDRWEAMIDQYE